MILFINSCVRSESRTRKLAKCLLDTLGGEYEELKTAEIDYPAVDEEFLKKRDRLIAEEDYDDPMFNLAKQYAAADEIVIAAPYWDLSFPASLKQYIEQISVVGITFEYSADGIPRGLCRAKKIYYVTTVGGVFSPDDFGFGYIKSLAENYHSIHDIELIKAEGLDVYIADTDRIMQDCVEQIKRIKK